MLGGLDYVGVLQIDLDSIDYVAKLEIHCAAVSIKCLVNTYHVCVIPKYKPIFSAVHELERNA